MATQTQTSSGGGIGFVGALTLLFIGLKLAGFIDWSWVWVLAPIWITALIAMLFIIGFVIFLTVDKRSRSKAAKQRRASRAVRDYGRSVR